jgi:hypothetical protein
MPEFWSTLIAQGEEVTFWKADITFTLPSRSLPDIKLKRGYDLWISIRPDDGYCQIGIFHTGIAELWPLGECNPQSYQQFYAIAERLTDGINYDEYESWVNTAVQKPHPPVNLSGNKA